MRPAIASPVTVPVNPVASSVLFLLHRERSSCLMPVVAPMSPENPASGVIRVAGSGVLYFSGSNSVQSGKSSAFLMYVVPVDRDHLGRGRQAGVVRSRSPAKADGWVPTPVAFLMAVIPSGSSPVDSETSTPLVSSSLVLAAAMISSGVPVRPPDFVLVVAARRRR